MSSVEDVEPPRKEDSKGLKYVTVVAVGTVFWGYYITKRVNRMLIRRYGDVVYQIRRAESLSNRYTAFKYFTVGGAVVPAIALGALYVTREKKDPNTGEAYTKLINDEAAAASRVASQKIARYANNANKRLEHIAEGVKGSVLEKAGPRMAEDLRKDVAAVKRWIKGLF